MLAKIQYYLITAAVLLVIAVITVLYIKSLKSDLEAEKSLRAVAEQQVEIQNKTIQDLNDSIKRNKEALDSANQQIQQFRDDAEKEQLDIENRDYDKEASEDTKKLEEDINKQFNQIYTDIRDASR